MTGWPALIRVQVPDRPGALGLIASRIGALKADIVSIEVLDRRDGMAIDLLAVVLPDSSLATALTREIHEVDGAAVLSIDPVPDLSARRTDVLGSAVALARTATMRALAEQLAAVVSAHLSTRWCVVIAPEFVVGTTDADETDAEVVGAAAAFSAPVGTATVTMHLGRELTLTPDERQMAESFCDLAGALWERHT